MLEACLSAFHLTLSAVRNRAGALLLVLLLVLAAVFRVGGGVVTAGAGLLGVLAAAALVAVLLAVFLLQLFDGFAILLTSPLIFGSFAATVERAFVG